MYLLIQLRIGNKGINGTEKVCIQKQNKEKSVQEPMEQEEKQVLNNSELTDKQSLFCVYCPKYFNATKAAIKAGYSRNRALEIGCQLLQKTTVQNEIKKFNIVRKMQMLMRMNCDKTWELKRKLKNNFKKFMTIQA